MKTQVDESKITLRKADKHDVDIFVRFEQACFPEEPWPKSAFVLEFKCGAQGLIAQKGNEAVGCMLFTVGKKGRTVEVGEIYISSIATLPTARKQGIGTQMIKWLMDFGATTKVKTKKIALEVRASNVAAQNVYKNLGFAIVGEEANYYADGESAYRMEYAYK